MRANRMWDTRRQRERMVRRTVAARGIVDQATLDAMRTVPREVFVPAVLARRAYDDGPLPIGEGQTISQPFVVALMIQALELSPDDRVLEVGAGSGYAAAVLSRIVREVFALERLERLAGLARSRLADLGYANVHVIHADGSLGWPAGAPYDAILVSAGAEQIPEPLVGQLVIGGRLVIPVGPRLDAQQLVRIRRTGPDATRTEMLGPVRFVPLITESAAAGGL